MTTEKKSLIEEIEANRKAHDDADDKARAYLRALTGTEIAGFARVSFEILKERIVETMKK